MRGHTRSTVFATSIALLAGVLVALTPGVASAEPVEQLFTDQIDPYADYDGADSCSPTDKPGARTSCWLPTPGPRPRSVGRVATALASTTRAGLLTG